MPVITKRTQKRRRKRVSILNRTIDYENTGLKLNLYGRSGTGKTTLWSTFPKPILAIICSSIQDAGELLSIPKAMRKHIKAVELEDSAEIREVVNYQNESEHYATVVLDHATGLQDFVMREILGLSEIPVQLNWGAATQAQYGEAGIKMREYLRALLQLKCNVVIVAQERAFNTGEERNEVLLPYIASALMPSVVGWLNPACNYIAETFIRTKTIEKKVKIRNKTKTIQVSTEEVEYCLRTGASGVYTIKFRVPIGEKKIPSVIVDPTYDKITAMLD